MPHNDAQLSIYTENVYQTRNIQPILTNKTSNHQIDKHPDPIPIINEPSTGIDIDSGFCGMLNNKHDRDKFKEPLDVIHNLQFRKDDFEDDNHKYFIIDYLEHWGLFSEISIVHPLITLSIATNRKFLWHFTDNQIKRNWEECLHDI